MPTVKAGGDIWRESVSGIVTIYGIAPTGVGKNVSSAAYRRVDVAFEQGVAGKVEGS